MTYMYDYFSKEYHWIPQVFEKLNLPVYDSMKEAVKQIDENRYKHLQRFKLENVKKENRNKNFTAYECVDISSTDIPKDQWLCHECSTCARVEKSNISVIPSLPSDCWMQRATSKIHDYSNISKVHDQKDPDFKIVPCVEISRSKCVEIKGDGNCLF